MMVQMSATGAESHRHSARPWLQFAHSSAGAKRDKDPGIEFSFLSPKTHLFFTEFSFKLTKNKHLVICKMAFPMHSLHRELRLYNFPKTLLVVSDLQSVRK